LRNCSKKSDATHDVRGVESLGALLAFELNRITLVQSLVSVLLDSGKMNEDIFSRGTLDKTVSFGSVEPLHHAIFLQANTLSRLCEFPALLRDTTSSRRGSTASPESPAMHLGTGNNYTNWPSEHFEQ
jgi:hypothetical protein